MALADDIELQETAEELVAEFGRPVLLVPAGGDSDPAQPWKGKGARPPGTTVDAVFQNLNKELVSGTAIQLGDSLAIIASRALSSPISTSHVLIDGDFRWLIVAPVESRPGKTSFVWFLQVRQAGA
ncbi:MAG: hypothetical protein KAI80_00060 [Hyphomicrobiaceae bacterium]|nr:hypothetical protein [Hyphomicrobiaceae bacterium]